MRYKLRITALSDILCLVRHPCPTRCVCFMQTRVCTSTQSLYNYLICAHDSYLSIRSFCVHLQQARWHSGARYPKHFLELSWERVRLNFLLRMPRRCQLHHRGGVVHGRVLFVTMCFLVLLFRGEQFLSSPEQI